MAQSALERPHVADYPGLAVTRCVRPDLQCFSSENVAVFRLLKIVASSVRVGSRRRCGGRDNWLNVTIGNVLRHDYHETYPTVLWDTCNKDLKSLKGAVERIAKSIEADRNQHRKTRE